MGLLVLAGVLAVFGLSAFLEGRKRSLAVARIRSAGGASVAGLPEGARVEIAGTSHCEESLAEPSSGDKCVYYAYRVEHEEISRDHGGRPKGQLWNTVASGRSAVPFTLPTEAVAVVETVLGEL